MEDEEKRRLFEYFIVAGLKPGCEQELASNSQEGVGVSISESVAPITDICVIFTGSGETVPQDFECIQTTPQGYPANLNHGSLTSPAAFLCIKRGFHKPPLIDLGVLDESKCEKPMTDSTIIERTPFGRSANLNTSQGFYFTTRRAEPNGPPHQLVITHVCVILENKSETPPYSYFKIDKNLNKGMIGSSVYVCYKKSQSGCKRIAYKPEVLDCFPPVANITESLALNVPMFCLPMGTLVESWPEGCKPAEKQYSTCVLTDEAGTKFYGTSLTFYENYTGELTDNQLEKLELSYAAPNSTRSEEKLKATYNCNKAICIVSRYPFFESFRRFLYFIYSLSSASEPLPVPIERYISHLMYEAPFPSLSRPRILVQLNHETISFDSYDDSQVPFSGATFVESLKCLGVSNIINALLLALLEQKILVHSLRPWLLTYVAETICSMMFPFSWQCPYIPQCPLALAGVLHAPLPFIAGVDSRYFDLYEEPPSDVTCFDLDTMTVNNSEILKVINLSMFPKKPLKRLRNTLSECLEKINVIERDKPRSVEAGLREKYLSARTVWERRVREAFLRFMCSLMLDYVVHLQPIRRSPKEVNATETSFLFNIRSFLHSREKNSLEFYKRFCATQCFIRFIEERTFVSDKNIFFTFFDDCILKVTTDKEAQLIDSDSHAISRTFVVQQPSILTDQLKHKQFRYDQFPVCFNQEFFETESIMKERHEELFTSIPYQPPIAPTRLRYFAVRAKPELKNSLSQANKMVSFDESNWPRSILFYSYSLWFLQLPSMLVVAQNKHKILKLSITILTRMERSRVNFHDQVCYRTLMYLCGRYGFPELAIQVLHKMRCCAEIYPNAITYGVYHYALMQGEWPSTARQNALRCWRKIRFLLEACMAFHMALGPDAPSFNRYFPSDEETKLIFENCRIKPVSGLNSNSKNNSLPSIYRNSYNIDGSVDEDNLINGALELSERATSSMCSEDSRSVQSSNGKTSQVDPLGALDGINPGGMGGRMPIKVESSPSRERFMKQFYDSPFAGDQQNSTERKRRKSLRGTSWIKNIASPLLSTLMRPQKANNLTPSISKNDTLRSNSSVISDSPSLSSFVKHALKGGNALLRQSEMGMSMLNKSVASMAHNISSLSGVPSGDDSDSEGLPEKRSQDLLFQLDSGYTGDFLDLQFWMQKMFSSTSRREIEKFWTKGIQTAKSEKIGEMKERDAFSYHDVALSSCTPCPNCNTIVYDDEVVAGWTVDDANLKTRCPNCQNSFITSLSVKIRCCKEEPSISSWYFPVPFEIFSNEPDSNGSVVDSSSIENDLNFTVPFLSPLVLRRELEVLILRDQIFLSRPAMRTAHPIIYWNLLYYCRRLNLPTHLLTWISANAHIRCVYDVPTLHTNDVYPLYFANHQTENKPPDNISSLTIRKIILHLKMTLDFDKTRELFASLIRRPALKDEHLQKPPFKFIHDIVTETLRACPDFLLDFFTLSDLDFLSVSDSRETKIGFVRKLIDALNTDGSLNDVKPEKMVAGKEPELTNLLLQRLAIDAAAYLTSKSKKKKSNREKTSVSIANKSSTREKEVADKAKKAKKFDKEASLELINSMKNSSASTPASKEKTTKNKPISDAEKVISKLTEDKPKRSKSKSHEHSSHSSKEKRISSTREKESAKDISNKKASTKDKDISNKKEKKKNDGRSIVASSSKSSKKRSERNSIVEHFIQNSPPQNHLDIMETVKTVQPTTTARESSGGTSKGDDSGIAEENSAESGRHDSSRHFDPRFETNVTEILSEKFVDTISSHEFMQSSLIEPYESPPPLTRPQTTIGRPQTAIGRPGTAVARPAPPRLKKNILTGSNDVNLTSDAIVSTGQSVPLILDASDDAGKAAGSNDIHQFLVEEDDEIALIEVSNSSTGGIYAAQLRDTGEHGALVNRIIENTRDQLEKELSLSDDASLVDVNEQRRIMHDIEGIQRAVQFAMQNIHPLARVLESVAFDFDSVIKVIHDTRKASVQAQRELEERNSSSGSETDSMIIRLRVLDAEIADVRTQISQAMTRILKNEQKIEAHLYSSN